VNFGPSSLEQARSEDTDVEFRSRRTPESLAGSLFISQDQVTKLST
jgi:hypothetical protein